jgi:hypothetical protein
MSQKIAGTAAKVGKAQVGAGESSRRDGICRTQWELNARRPLPGSAALLRRTYFMMPVLGS